MKKFLTVLSTSVTLCLITFIAVLLLAFVNEKTEPVITANENIKIQNSLKDISEGSVFEEVEITDKFIKTEETYNCKIDKIYISKYKNDALAGVCSIITGNGYNSGLQIAVGISAADAVYNIEIISSSETPGLGQNASNPEFKDQFKNKMAGLSVVKSNAGIHQINALSGATITSKGITNIVNAAFEIAHMEGVKEQ